MRLHVRLLLALSGLLGTLFVAGSAGSGNVEPRHALPAMQTTLQTTPDLSFLAGPTPPLAETRERGLFGVWGVLNEETTPVAGLRHMPYAPVVGGQGWVGGVAIGTDAGLGPLVWSDALAWRNGVLQRRAVTRDALARNDVLVYWHRQWESVSHDRLTMWKYAEDVPGTLDEHDRITPAPRQFRDVIVTGVPAARQSQLTATLTRGGRGGMPRSSDPPRPDATEWLGSHLAWEPEQSASPDGQRSSFGSQIPPGPFTAVPQYEVTLFPSTERSDDDSVVFTEASCALRLPRVPAGAYTLCVTQEDGQWQRDLVIPADSDEPFEISFHDTLNPTVPVPVSLAGIPESLLETHSAALRARITIPMNSESGSFRGSLRVPLTREEGHSTTALPVSWLGNAQEWPATLELEANDPRVNQSGISHLAGYGLVSEQGLRFRTTEAIQLVEIRLPDDLRALIAPTDSQALWRGVVRGHSRGGDSPASPMPLRVVWGRENDVYKLFAVHEPGMSLAAFFVRVDASEDTWSRWTTTLRYEVRSPDTGSLYHPRQIFSLARVAWSGPIAVSSPYDMPGVAEE